MNNKTKLKSIEAATNRLEDAREKSLKWLLENINGNGEPKDADKDIGWSRIPWALALSGKLDTAGSVMQWAEASKQFDKSGTFSFQAKSVKIGTAYWLAHYPIGAMMLGRYDIAERTIGKLSEMQDSYGGFTFVTIDGKNYTDLLSTAQVGLTAVICGSNEIAHTVYNWVERLIAMQTSLDQGIMYTFCIGDKLVVEIPKGFEFLAKVDLNKPRQAFFNPGIAAVFLIAYGQKYRLKEAFELAEKLLEMNENGTEKQFNDPESVQICKYGWGIASLVISDPIVHQKWIPELIKMAEWFADMQNNDGSWAPSKFLIESPSIVQSMSKTAEHLMEVNAIITALGCIKGLYT